MLSINVKYGEKIVIAPLPEGFCIALELFNDLDFVYVIKHNLGPAKPTFDPRYEMYLAQGAR